MRQPAGSGDQLGESRANAALQQLDDLRDLVPPRGEIGVGATPLSGLSMAAAGSEPGLRPRSPSCISDNTCPHCRRGFQSSCQQREFIGGAGAAGARPACRRHAGRDARIASRRSIPSLLATSDVLGTGWYAADAARVQPGSTVAVVGDGAVGLMGVLAAKQMGAGRIIAMSRHRRTLARFLVASPGFHSRLRFDLAHEAGLQKLGRDLLPADAMVRAMARPGTAGANSAAGRTQLIDATAIHCNPSSALRQRTVHIAPSDRRLREADGTARPSHPSKRPSGFKPAPKRPRGPKTSPHRMQCEKCGLSSLALARTQPARSAPAGLMSFLWAAAQVVQRPPPFSRRHAAASSPLAAA